MSFGQGLPWGFSHHIMMVGGRTWLDGLVGPASETLEVSVHAKSHCLKAVIPTTVMLCDVINLIEPCNMRGSAHLLNVAKTSRKLLHTVVVVDRGHEPFYSVQHLTLDIET